jgi:hypothetical protein
MEGVQVIMLFVVVNTYDSMCHFCGDVLFCARRRLLPGISCGISGKVHTRRTSARVLARVPTWDHAHRSLIVFHVAPCVPYARIVSVRGKKGQCAGLNVVLASLTRSRRERLFRPSMCDR